MSAAATGRVTEQGIDGGGGCRAGPAAGAGEDRELRMGPVAGPGRVSSRSARRGRVMASRIGDVD